MTKEKWVEHEFDLRDPHQCGVLGGMLSSVFINEMLDDISKDLSPECREMFVGAVISSLGGWSMSMIGGDASNKILDQVKEMNTFAQSVQNRQMN